MGYLGSFITTKFAASIQSFKIASNLLRLRRLSTARSLFFSSFSKSFILHCGFLLLYFLLSLWASYVLCVFFLHGNDISCVLKLTEMLETEKRFWNWYLYYLKFSYKQPEALIILLFKPKQGWLEAQFQDDFDTRFISQLETHFSEFYCRTTSDDKDTLGEIFSC
jgi:hypothetical protein